MFQQLKLVMDSVMWAFRHTERNIAETGLNLLLEMLKNFQVDFRDPWILYIFYLCIFLNPYFSCGRVLSSVINSTARTSC